MENKNKSGYVETTTHGNPHIETNSGHKINTVAVVES
jgi:hypothetical protein